MIDQMLQAKMLIYVLTSSILKVHPNYFSENALLALESSQTELIAALRDLNTEVNIDDLMVCLFSKEKLH